MTLEDAKRKRDARLHRIGSTDANGTVTDIIILPMINQEITLNDYMEFKGKVSNDELLQMPKYKSYDDEYTIWIAYKDADGNGTFKVLN